jgi:predicted O-methyltransferase YrrM
MDELALVNALIQKHKPKKIFEFGTFDGRTTLNMAAASPDNALVYTLDLPDTLEHPLRLPLDKNDKSYIGAMHEKRFTGTPYEKKVVRLHGDSGRFDYAPFRNQMDFVFVDASHACRYVMNDSCEALELLRDGKGHIVWHDYARWPGVTRALNVLYLKNPGFARLKHIKGTTLAYLSLGLQS